MIDLEIAKKHLRIEPDDTSEDDMIAVYLATAVEYVQSLTDIQNDVNSPKMFDLAVMLLTAHYFQNREMVTNGQATSIPYGFDMIMQNIRPATGLI